MSAVAGCSSTGFAVWIVIAHHQVHPLWWVIGPASLLGLIPVNRLPKWLRDLSNKVQIAAGLGVFALGLVLDLTALGGITVPGQAYKLTFWLAIFGIGLMIVGLLTARIGINDWAERLLASPRMQERLEGIEWRRRHR